MKGRLIELFIKEGGAERVLWYQPILTYIDSPHIAAVARQYGHPRKTVSNWVRAFESFMAGYFTRLALYHASSTQQRRRQKDAADTYCDMTHRQSGGDGSTPPIGTENYRARTCPECAERAGAKGDTGWNDLLDVQMARRAL